MSLNGPIPDAVPCQHLNFEARVDVARLADDDKPLRFRADVVIQCADCQQEFMFTGIDAIGYRQNSPSLNVARTQVSMPIAPWDGSIATGATYEFGEVSP